MKYSAVTVEMLLPMAEMAGMEMAQIVMAVQAVKQQQPGVRVETRNLLKLLQPEETVETLQQSRARGVMAVMVLQQSLAEMVATVGMLKA